MSGALALVVVRDPSAEGWAVTVGYAVAAALCLVAGRRERRAVQGPGDSPSFWLMVGSALLLLTLNKQLDFHNLVTAGGRHVVRAVGLWEARRLIQASFVVVLGVAAACAGGLLMWTSGRQLIRLPFACCGIVMLSALVLLRAASFHHLTDAWPALSASYHLRLLLELGGALLIAADAGRVLVGWTGPDPPSDATRCEAGPASRLN